ncbi:testis-expressed protein 11 isoform X2 [Chiloscyllium punctatum]|uniref:testis-expressed protein 11 isoform X2 n=1 Tax=Chiloscyllium punctatum TaxID=137246 RepID=UPI003B631A3A
MSKCILKKNLEMDVGLIFTEIKGLAEELLGKQSTRNVEEVIDKLYVKVTTLDEIARNKTMDTQVEEYAINLWNWAVTKRLESSINDEQRTKLRHVACKLVCLYDCAEPNEVTLQRQVLMFMKTGKSWLDCRKPLLADGFLDLALTSLEVLYAKLLAGYDGQSDINVLKNDVEKDLFKVHSYRAESAVIQCDHVNAVTCIQRCKDILLRIPKETGYLSLLCYNFGIDTYQQKKYEESAFWLSQSYDIGKIDKRYSPSSPVQAKVLRLLANVYLEWDVKQHQERALNAVILANQENPHPAGLFLKIKILLKGIFPDPVISAAVSDLLGKVSLDVCLEAAKLLLEHDRDDLSFEFLTTLSKQFETSHDIGKILLMHLMQLLQRGKDELAKQKIEDIIAGHYSGKRLSSDILTRFHIVLWEKATKNFEVQKCTEALQWYSYSLSFFSDGQLDQNLARLQRNRALCYLHLNHLEKAKEAVKAAEQIDPDNFFTQFNIYKIAILESDTQKAMEAIKAIGKLAEKSVECEHNIVTNRISVTDFLSLAAHFALENDQEDAARIAFEYLCEYSQDCNQLLTALRCLIRLVPSITGTDDQQTRFERLDSLKSYLKAAYEKLIVHVAEGKMTVELKSSEANWFRKIALQCENCPSRMRDFFTLSYQIASLTQAREHIQICWDIWATLKATVGGDVSKDPTETLLLLYEFEARAKLNDPKIEDVLERMLQLQKIEPKTLETLASLAMESPAHYPSVCKKALKIAFSLQKKQPDKDVIRCSKLLHSLIQISLPTGLMEIESQVLEEVWWYYEEALMIIENSQEEYPEVEMLWLMTRAWNTGASLYSLGKYTEAEKWCGLGMRFLKHLGSLRASYESQMIGLYAEILDRMDREKKVLPVEE